MIAALGTIIACAALNRVRGDARWMPAWLPGRTLWYVAPLIALLAAFQSASAFTGIAWGLGYLIWAIPAWGHLMGMGRFIPPRPPSDFEAVLIEISAGSYGLAFFIRNLLAVPAFIAVAILAGEPMLAFWAAPFAAGIIASYEAAWRLRPDNPIWLAEIATGALWGVAIVSI